MAVGAAHGVWAGLRDGCGDSREDGRVFYENVWGSDPIPSPREYPRLSEAIAGGLYHPNCRDIHSTYFEDFSSPSKPLTEEEKKEAARVYALEQKQRYNERQIRKYKRLSDGSVDPANQERYRKKLSEWQERQRDFVKANGDVLRRRYENEKLRLPSVPEPPKIPGPKEIPEIPKTKGLTNVGEDGIIKPLKMTTDEKSALTRYISSESYGLFKARTARIFDRSTPTNTKYCSGQIPDFW